MGKKRDVRPRGPLVDEDAPVEGSVEEPRPVSAEEFFDAALAQEMAKSGPSWPPRRNSPFNLALALSFGAAVPEGAWVDYPEEQEICFLVDDGEEVDYPFSVKIFAPRPAEVEAAVNVMIRAGQKEIRHEGLEIVLHATPGPREIARVPGQELFTTVLNYIFRVRPIEDAEARR